MFRKTVCAISDKTGMECSGKRCVQSPIKRDMKMFNKAGHAVPDKTGYENVQ